MPVRIRPPAIFVALAALVLVVSCLLAVFFLRGKSGVQETRGPATNYMLILADRDLPAWIENSGANGCIWGMREKIDGTFFNSALARASQLVLDAPRLAKKFLADATGVSVTRRDNPDDPYSLAPILPPDGFSTPRLLGVAAPDQVDAMDASGRPFRWFMPESLMIAQTPLPPRPEPAAILPTPELPTQPTRGSAGNYRELVENFSRRYNLNSSLVMAIIHSESDFSPTLVSDKSAMGLMQLLPSTASGEVHKFLYGHRGNISFEQLRVPEINIRYGTAYLHILLNRYFSNVRDRDVRENCVIAAYNLGPNRFLRLYGATNDKAVENINSMSAEEFHRDLPGRLPARETRYFVEKVRRMKRHYSGGGGNGM